MQYDKECNRTLLYKVHAKRTYNFAVSHAFINYSLVLYRLNYATVCSLGLYIYAQISYLALSLAINNHCEHRS